MNFKQVPPPKNRGDFESRVNYLAAMIHEQKLSFPLGMGIDDLMKIRTLPNGRVNLLTIEESARTTMGMAFQMAQEESLHDNAEL